MRRIGLLTWNTYENYGTHLQWYALTKVLADMGYDVTAIRYVPRPTPQGDILPDSVRSLLAHYARAGWKKIDERWKPIPDDGLNDRHARFATFRERELFKYTGVCETASDLFSLNNDFDCFVCGSDQIWSPFCFDAHYFLDFVADGQKKIAYAPSLGCENVKNPYIAEQLFPLVKDFAAVSVREISGAKLMKEQCGMDVPVVLDPTLLLSETAWNDVANNAYETPKRYILCYFLGKQESHWRQVRRLAKRTGLPLVVLPVFGEDFDRAGNVPKDVGPAEFISLIKRASFVCTDSYHGAIFSFIFHRKFAIFPRFKRHDVLNQNTRIDTITRHLNLGDRIVGGNNSLFHVYALHDDFSDSAVRHTQLRKESLDWLSHALGSVRAAQDTHFAITNTCCGCGVCATVCPKNAVTVRRDDEGFLRSFVDADRCVRCLLCRSVCPFYQKSSLMTITGKNALYAIKSRNPAVLCVSSSGGAGFELMDYFRRNGKSVTGCLYDSAALMAKGQCFDGGHLSEQDLVRLQGSKYIQSDYTGVFKELKNLGSGVITGLPCQVAAARNYLHHIGRRNDFLLVDLICHGVPSQNLWYTYIAEKQKIFHFKSSPSVMFRNKPLGWAQRFISLSCSDSEINISSKKDLFYAFFLAGNCYAESCYECNYRCASCADLRIADYWGPRFKDDKTGVSMCIPLTDAGKHALCALEKDDRISCVLTDIQDMFCYQQTKNAVLPLERDAVLAAFKSTESLVKLKKKFLHLYHLQERVWKMVVVFRKVRNVVRKQSVLKEGESSVQPRHGEGVPS